MKLCFNTSAFAKHELEPTLEKLGKLGYDGVEMMVDRPHAFPDDFDELRVKKVKDILAKQNLIPVGLMSANVWAWGSKVLFEPSFINVDKDIRKRRISLTKQIINMAAELGCASVQTGAGTCNFAGFPNPNEAWGYLVEGIEECAAYAGSRGVVLTIEQEPGSIVESTIDMARIVKDVSSDSFGLTFDVGHLAVMGEDIIQSIGLLCEHIINVHIEDIQGRRHYHLIPGEGEGTLNLQRIVDELKAVGYDGFLTADLYTQENNPEYAAQKSYEYLSKLL